MMNSTDEEKKSCNTDDKSQSKGDCEDLKVGEGDSLAKPARVESSCSTSTSDKPSNAEDKGETGSFSMNKYKENITKQDCPENLIENEENNSKCDLEDKLISDTQEEKVKLRWDDDQKSLEIGENIATDINEESDEDFVDAITTDKPDDLLETVTAANNEKESMQNIEVASVSQNNSFIESQVLVRREHGINKPDVMLDIPGMLPDMDEELESMNIELLSDNEKDSNPEETDAGLSELVSKVNAEILSSLEENELDSKLEMSSDYDDDNLENTATANKAELAEAIEKEMKLLSDTMSSIDEQDSKETKPTDLAEVITEPTIDESNLITAIQNEVKSLEETLSNIEQDDPMDNVPISESEDTLIAPVITEENNDLELQVTPCEQREKDMNLKVTTLISSIEEEMQLLDSNDEMETSEISSDSNKLKKQNKKETVVKIPKHSTDSVKDKVEKLSTEAEVDLKTTEEIMCISDTEPKKKELDENELRQKEQDELAQAVKAIEPEDQIYESAPAVTLVNIYTTDELSKISAIEEDDQPSMSLVLDGDESIEVLHQNAGPVSAVIDEAEVSVIQDSEDEELPVLVPDSDDISKEPITQKASTSTEIREKNNKQSEGLPDVINDVISTECRESAAYNINEEKCLKQAEQEAAESAKVETEIPIIEKLDDKKQDMSVDEPSVTIPDNDKSSFPAPDDSKMDDNISGEVEKYIGEIDSTAINKDDIKQSLTSQDLAKNTNDETSFAPEEKAISLTESNEKMPIKDPEDSEPLPSTSSVDLDVNKDSSNDVPDSDTLGLLAESTRVMDDDDDQDDDEDDDDDDFYQDDESNLMTAEHSEDSNHPSDDAQEAQDVVETEEKEMTKHTELESIDGSMVCDVEEELPTPEREEAFQFTVSSVTNDDQKDTKAVEAMEIDVPVEAKVVDSDEPNKEKDEKNTKTKEPEEPIPEPAKKTDTSGIVEKTSEKAESVTEKEIKLSDLKLNLSIVPQRSVWNFVDLEESSEDEIQIVPKPVETPATTKQPEPQPDSAQPTAEKQPDKDKQPKQPEVSPAPGAVEVGRVPDVDMTMEILDEELLKADEPKDTMKNATEVTPTEKQDENSSSASLKQSEKLGGLEVFNLDSDDEDSTAPAAPLEAPQPKVEPAKRETRCINTMCKYSPGVAWLAADADTVAYYDGDKRRRALVCEDCWRPVQTRNEDLIEGIRNLTPLLELDMATLSLDLVEISDSDSEGEPDTDEQEEKIGDIAAKFLEDNLADMINETWVKYKMDSRLSDTESVLQMEMRRLETESAEISSFLAECQATTDRVRNELYASFPQDIQELPPLIVYDTPDQQYCYVQASVPPSSGENPAPTPTRSSKRRLEAATEHPAKRPAIPLGYSPLGSEQVENKTSMKSDAEEKIDDDNTDVSVVNIISSEVAPPGLPPAGELVKPPLRVGMTVYAMRNSFGSWVKGRILEIMPKGTQSLAFTTCKVKFENRNSKTPVKTILARCMAYSEPANVRLTIGTRVIANFKDNKDKPPSEPASKRESYFSGIVAEVPNPVNKYRYLIFFDDGYAQYASHADTRLVCECASLVWEEVHPFSREFVREYLLAYPERPMVRLHPFQSLKTEWNGKWWSSRVISVDASLAQVHFPSNNRYEWIYRGSTRLAPLYLELQAAERHRARPMPRAQALARANMPVVEYTRYDEQSNKTYEVDKSPQQQTDRQEAEAIRQRAVAKKSTGGAVQPAPPPVRLPPGHMPPGHNLDNVTSRVVYYTPKNAVKPHKMVPHTCGPQCKRTDVLALSDLRTYNPLAKPLLSGWERQIVRYKGQKAVSYRAPCGRRVRNARELHRYLRATRADLPVDLFDFSPNTHCLAEFVLNKCLIMKKDLSQGKENVPVPCVNYYDESLPEFCLYNTERTPTAGVPLNLDPEFLCGCDCEDDCEDKSKCACWKLTLEGARTIGLEGDNVGYVYKRLPEPLPSGIYECNSRCKCKHTCLNRVAQHPLQLKLQIFKTLNRGWGIRALNDVPKGSFLCVYAGNLLTDATATLDGLNEGDEYLAELDYIEVVEQMKEGYEEDIPKDLKKMTLEDKERESEESSSSSSEDERETTSKTELADDDFTPAPHVGIRVTQFSKRLRQRNRNKEDNKNTDDKKENEKEKEKEKEKGKEDSKKEGERGSNDEECITISDDDEVREPSSFAAAAGMGSNAFVSKYRSVRSLFGEDESCYIMDAKVQGNIGRYLNHSCSPNVFVQNVFVDTHDPRFPWVAFFALSHVRAGTELTWNYNYDVGSVPGKALYCYCGAPNCRGRLL